MAGWVGDSPASRGSGVAPVRTCYAQIEETAPQPHHSLDSMHADAFSNIKPRSRSRSPTPTPAPPAPPRPRLPDKGLGRGLAVTGYCAGGLLTARDPADRRQRIDDNRRMVDEAVAIGSSCLVALGGGLDPGDRDIDGARRRALDGFAELLPYVRDAGIVLALEPLHPMVCATRSVLCTLRGLGRIKRRLPWLREYRCGRCRVRRRCESRQSRRIAVELTRFRAGEDEGMSGRRWRPKGTGGEAQRGSGAPVGAVRTGPEMGRPGVG